VKVKQEEEQDFVNRQPDGGFLLGLAQFGEIVAVPQVMTPKTEEEADQEGEMYFWGLNHNTGLICMPEVDAHYVSIARQYFTSGASLGGRGSKKHEDGRKYKSLFLWVVLLTTCRA
jgi:hypothetical protein